MTHYYLLLRLYILTLNTLSRLGLGKSGMYKSILLSARKLDLWLRTGIADR